MHPVRHRLIGHYLTSMLERILRGREEGVQVFRSYRLLAAVELEFHFMVNENPLSA